MTIALFTLLGLLSFTPNAERQRRQKPAPGSFGASKKWSEAAHTIEALVGVMTSGQDCKPLFCRHK